MSHPSKSSASLSENTIKLNEEFVTLEDLTSKPGDTTKQAQWARNLSVVPMDLKEILKSILESEKH